MLTGVPQAEWLWRKFQAYLELMLRNITEVLVGKSESTSPTQTRFPVVLTVF
jgi:hypothetical protein